MLRFNDFYISNLDESAFEWLSKPANVKPASLMLGRIQPLTTAHVKLIKQLMKKQSPVIVAIVKGANSNRDKNPFSLKTQTKMIKAIFGSKVIIVDIAQGFIGDAINAARKKGYEITYWAAGADRAQSYQRQLDKYKDDGNYDIQLVNIKRTDDDISATKVRQALLDDDVDTFNSMTPPKIHNMYQSLRKEMGA